MSSDNRRLPVGIAIFGVGHWGPNLLRNFSEDSRSQVLYVVDRDPERLALVAPRYPAIVLTDDAEVALADDAVTAVVIATPASTHFPLARAVLEANKHCLVEKPLATDALAAKILVAMAADRGLTLAVGHVFLYNLAVRLVKEYIDRGELGGIYYVSMVRTNLGPPGIDVNVAWDLATHDVSIANYWLGAHAATVSARGASWISPNPEREDTLFATLTYPTGQLVHINDSWLSPRKVRDIVVVGSRLMVTIDDMNPTEPVRIYDKGIDPEDTPAFVDSYDAFRASIRDGDVRIPHISGGEPLRLEGADFLQCVIDGRVPLADGESAVAVVGTIDAINRSMRNGGREERVE